MEKEEITKKIDNVKNLIKKNSVDAHYADTLINELLALDREKRHEATLIHIPMDSITMSCKDEYFEMCYTQRDEAIYKTTGGYTIICDNPFNPLNETIRETIKLVNNEDELTKDMTEEQKNLIAQDIMATTWVLNIAPHACSDLDFKYQMANHLIDWMIAKQEDADKDELQEETVSEDKEFEGAMKGIDELRKAVEEKDKE